MNAAETLQPSAGEKCQAGAPNAASSSPRIDTVAAKIQARHRERLAIVYVRQSDPHQVLNNRESRERQYALADRAVELGWPREQVVVIDDDTGTTAKTAEHRS